MIGGAVSSQSSGRQQPLSFVGNYLLFARNNVPRRGRVRNRANTRNLYTKRRWDPAPLSMSTKKYTPPSVATQQFTPFPFLNNVASPPAWSPVAMSYSVTAVAKEECALPPDTKDNFSRYSKFLVKNSNGVDGMGRRDEDERKESIQWVDTLGVGRQCVDYQNGSEDSHPKAPHPFSILSWNILAQSLYEAQYQRRKIQQVALTPSSTSPHQPELPSSLPSTSSPHPHPWPKRAKRIIEILSHYDPDIICLQECEAQSFQDDLLPALSKLGYDGIAQEDVERPDLPMKLKEATKHRYPRNHIVATFWKKKKFEPEGEALVRTRSLATVLRLKSDSLLGDRDDDGAVEPEVAAPTVAVVNVHLEGHPRRFSERTHQLLHAMSDLVKRIEHERERTSQSNGEDAGPRIGNLNALVLAGDFNCELQSSACSTYLRMGRLGRQAGLGGVHGEDSLALPPSLFESAECAEVIHPIMEWGRALPEEQVSDVGPHPFRRRNGMSSAYPVWLGRDDAREHFTFCSELSKRPVPGLDQMWFSSMTLERKALMRNFVDDSGLWERYFYDDAEVERMRNEERRRVLASGLPSLECKYPSDHLPIGAVFDWNWEDCGDACLLDNDDINDCVKGVRGLNVIGSEGNNIQDDALSDAFGKEKHKRQQLSFQTPHEELDYLLNCCPYDSEEQRSDVRFILSSLDPPLSLISKEKPTQEQLKQIGARREKKAEVLSNASMGVRPWLKNLWKASKQVGKWDRQREIEKIRLLEKSKC